MKHITRHLPLLTLPVILYLAGAFYNVTFNVAQWTEGTQWVVSVFGTMSVAIHAIIRQVQADDKSRP